MTVTTEAVIIGGGVMGTSILYNLAARGVKDPVLLERDTLGSGSTGRSSGAIRMHYSTEVNARLAWESLKIFQNFDEIVGGDVGFVKTGYMVFVPEDSIEGCALEHEGLVLVRSGIELPLHPSLLFVVHHRDPPLRPPSGPRSCRPAHPHRRGGQQA